MPYYKTIGIVLRRMNLGEADRIVTVFTRDHGKVRAVAKGVRRIKSRMAGHLEPFGAVELMFATGRNLDVITSARLVRSGEAIAETPSSLGYGFLLTEMLDRLVDEQFEQTQLYEVVEECFGDLIATGGDVVLELFFKLRLLDALGYHPQLSGCSICGRTDAVAYFFAAEIGGIVDSACATERRFSMELNEIKLWRLLMSHPLAEVRKVNEVRQAAQSSLEACNFFYDYTFGKRFMSSSQLFD